MTESLHLDDAIDILIESLAQVALPGPGTGQIRYGKTHGSDIWIFQIAASYWELHGKKFREIQYDEREHLSAPFYDAAWTLCRRGILRPAAAFPNGQTNSNVMGQQWPSSPFFGDGYSLTQWGREWVRQSVADRVYLPADFGRMTSVLVAFSHLFGSGYSQRASEGASAWRTGHYLSACTMAGAAAESILLATAIAKTGNQQRILAEYQSARGRAKVTKAIVAGAPALAGRFTDALGILGYWRDASSHGIASTIGEVEAHEALSRLLRLAQFTADNWPVLTGAGSLLPEAPPAQDAGVE
jgi:hypothetical protein